ncbi:MAG: N-acetylmuramoyl-L-alanine amidase [Gemmatimonadaceae bacterium]|nr:N-acetylmuramoyl-L-alanine amidase [Gemmatimonadaceae bacterium]
MSFRCKTSRTPWPTGRHRRRLNGTICAALLVAASACRTAGPSSTGSTAASRPNQPPTSTAMPARALPVPIGLPPVPVVSGAALATHVQYPSENQVIASRDSNFVLGSVGSGDATLSINGVAVPVAPNGAFIAWLANPPVAAPRYELVVSRGDEVLRRSLTVRYPARVVLSSTGSRLLDSTSVLPARGLRATATEWIRVSVRAAANARLQLELADGSRRPMIPLTRIQSTARQAALGARAPVSAEVTLDSAVAADRDVGLTFATDVPAAQLVTASRIVAVRGVDTTRLTVPVVQTPAPSERLLGVLRSTNLVGSDTDHVVNARTVPDGTYKWLLLPGTVLDITGRQNGSTRVRLDDALDVWVANEDIVALPEGSAMPKRVTGGLRVTPSRDWVDVSITMGERPAFLVEPDGRTLVLTMYGVQANPDISPILGNDTLIRRMSWDQVGSNRVRVTFTLSQPVYGWLSLWDESRRAFVLRIRRLPVIDPLRPLAGLTIAVDPGHPPAGATGPTGLYEGDAVLPVGELLFELLRTRGATPVLTRETLAPVGLTERAVAARRMNAHAFVSIHLNALPDGVNPFSANGTSTLFYHQSSEPLARPVQSALTASFGLRDLGVHYQNLAVARPTWYPSVLTEGLFVMMPEQEAAMRNPDFLMRYATAIADGLEAYFRTLSTP